MSPHLRPRFEHTRRLAGTGRFEHTRRLAGTGRFAVAAVGESKYQRALWAGIGGFRDEHVRERVTAALLLEPDNPEDPDAVAVHFETGEQVGYLARRDAREYAPAIRVLAEQGVVGICDAVVVGGGDYGDGRPAMVGIWLDLAPPDDVLRDPRTFRRSRRAADAGVATASASSPRSEAGHYLGHHYTEYVEDVKALKRHGALDAAVTLLRGLIDAVEAEASAEGAGVAPWYYEQLAIVLRRQRDRAGEVAVLERFAAQPHAPGASVARLLDRLDKTRTLPERSGAPATIPSDEQHPKEATMADYVPSTSDWVREQVELYERTNGAEGTTLRESGLPVIIVTNTGNKSGAIRKTPLMRVADGANYVLVGSKGGAPQHPVWVHNLRANQDVEIRDVAEVTSMRVREVEDGAERDRLWKISVEAYPPYAEYQGRTERKIPVFLAEPV